MKNSNEKGQRRALRADEFEARRDGKKDGVNSSRTEKRENSALKNPNPKSAENRKAGSRGSSRFTKEGNTFSKKETRPFMDRKEKRPFDKENKPYERKETKFAAKKSSFTSKQDGGFNERRSDERRADGTFAKPVRRPGSDNYDPNAKYSKKKQIEYRKRAASESSEMRLNRFLSNAGICSRREADEYISAGVVKVNGVIVTELGTRVKRTDKVLFHDQLVRSEKKVYVLLNKPKNCVTTSDDPQERLTVMDLVKDACSERIYPVGRLDRNTTGVLLLTNDGDMAATLTHPKSKKKKIYHVHLDKPFTKNDMVQLAEGIMLEDGEIHADEISYVDADDKKQVGIEVHSGRNRLVRRMFEHLGYKVEKLDRVYFGGLTKKGLNRGKWRFLTEKEIQMLRMGAYE